MSAIKPSKQKVAWMTYLRNARRYIITNPGCTSEAIYSATKVTGSRTGLGYLQRMKLIKRKDGRWWPIEAPAEPVDFGPNHGYRRLPPNPL